MRLHADVRVERAAFRLAARLDRELAPITAIVGASGSGKTTLLRAIAGLERQVTGRVSLGDRVWLDASVRRPVHERRVGFVFQDAGLFDFRSVRGNLAYAVDRNPDVAKEGILEMARRTGVEHLLDRSPAGLSGGERRRVALARTLLSSPALLLLDEPTAGLDATAARAVAGTIRRIAHESRVPVLYVTHSTDEVARVADDVIVLDAGRVHAAGRLAEVLTNLDLELARRDDAESVLMGTVTGHDADFPLAHVSVGTERFVTSDEAAPAGEVRLRIRARDVSLTHSRHVDTSILNVVPARVHSIWTGDRGEAVVRLLVEGQPLLSRITQRSLTALNVEEGAELFAQVKSVALLP